MKVVEKAGLSVVADSVFKIKEATPNFNINMPGGDIHCAFYGDFYAREVDGVRLVDWLKDFIDEDESVEDIVCEDCL